MRAEPWRLHRYHPPFGAGATGVSLAVAPIASVPPGSPGIAGGIVAAVVALIVAVAGAVWLLLRRRHGVSPGDATGLLGRETPPAWGLAAVTRCRLREQRG